MRKYEEIKDGVLVTPKGTRAIDHGSLFFEGEEYLRLFTNGETIFCRGIEEIRRLEVTDGVRRICMGSFRTCKNLEWAYISDSVKDIDSWAFRDCEKLSYIRLPQNIKRIKESTFCGCKSLKDIKIPQSVEFIGDLAFCNTAIESIFIPQNVQKIYMHPFLSCEGLKEIVVDERNKSYVSLDGVLYTKDMKTLVCYPAAREGEVYTVPKGVENLQRWCFCDNKQLKILRLPDTLKKIRGCEFSNRESRLTVRVGRRTRMPEYERKNVRFIVL